MPAYQCVPTIQAIYKAFYAQAKDAKENPNAKNRLGRMFTEQIIEVNDTKLTDDLWADYHADMMAAGQLPQYKVGSYFTGYTHVGTEPDTFDKPSKLDAISAAFAAHIAADTAIDGSLEVFSGYLAAKIAAFEKEVQKYEDFQARLHQQEDLAAEELRTDGYVTNYVNAKVAAVEAGIASVDASVIVDPSLSATGAWAPALNN
ncbi:hypothetical protein HXX76_014115 [Chlamydomonas incerta]|uniref:Uncharacterized protein n=1 Tax=Chlamydomonas incerta TaxID=51695 RepID=A0A835SCV9_CHLIN|nr:hypothetical protein HXX76_014115 [Chlamydomonas incerta]|eukprot:KAG2424957.1 hypothetical protein HXX76_014115 [Chlamydomonas incerta]